MSDGECISTHIGIYMHSTTMKPWAPINQQRTQGGWKKGSGEQECCRRPSETIPREISLPLSNNPLHAHLEETGERANNRPIDPMQESHRIISSTHARDSSSDDIPPPPPPSYEEALSLGLFASTTSVLVPEQQKQRSVRESFTSTDDVRKSAGTAAAAATNSIDALELGTSYGFVDDSTKDSFSASPPSSSSEFSVSAPIHEQSLMASAHSMASSEAVQAELARIMALPSSTTGSRPRRRGRRPQDQQAARQVACPAPAPMSGPPPQESNNEPAVPSTDIEAERRYSKRHADLAESLDKSLAIAGTEIMRHEPYSAELHGVPLHPNLPHVETKGWEGARGA